jgi:hypothetical protein
MTTTKRLMGVGIPAEAASVMVSDFQGISSGDMTVAGTITFSTAGDGIIDTVAKPAAAGTTQGAGTPLVSRVNYATATEITAGSVEAYTLPVAVPGTRIYFINIHPTAAAKIFPNTGGSIAGGAGGAVGADNAVYSLAALKNAVFIAITTTRWAVIVT